MNQSAGQAMNQAPQTEPTTEDLLKHRSQVIGSQRFKDVIFVKLTQTAAIAVLGIIIGIMVSLFIGSMPAIKKFGAGFFASGEWNPVEMVFGGLAPIYGTIVTSVIALVFAVPISFGIAIFITHLAPEFLKKPVGILVELLAGIPSIIYGMWGVFVFAPWFADHAQPFLQSLFSGIPILGTIFSGPPMGIGLLTAGIILAVMIIPSISSVMRDVFDQVPTLLKESAYGMGATTWEVINKIVVRKSIRGIFGAIILGLGRALGETMAVTFVIGNTYNITPHLFGSGVSITSALANEFGEATDETHLAALMLLSFTLFVISFLVLSLSKVLVMKSQKSQGNA